MEPQIPQYMTNLSLNRAPFRFNENYDTNQAGEANTYNNIFAEATYLYGVDVVYIERTIHSPEQIFGEYLAAELTSGTPMRLYNEELTGGQWGGGGDLSAKFGLQVTDEATFYGPKLIFAQAKLNPDPLTNATQQFMPFYPKQNDLIYFVSGKKLFEIQHIENEAAPGMYIFGNRNSYVFKCKLYTYDHAAVSATNMSIPPEIQALDNVTTIGTRLFDLKATEKAEYNDQVVAEVNRNTIIDNSELDPLLQ
jgi:hypothetical protein